MAASTDSFSYPVMDTCELRLHPELLDLPLCLLHKVVRIERLDGGVFCTVFSQGGARELSVLRIKRLQQSINERLSH